MPIWTPVIRQALLVKREPTSPKDKKHLRQFMKRTILGQLYHSPYLSRFLARDVNKAVAEVTGEIVNSGAGYGLEIPCVYRVYGPKTYVIKLKKLTDSLKAAGHICIPHL